MARVFNFCQRNLKIRGNVCTLVPLIMVEREWIPILVATSNMTTKLEDWMGETRKEAKGMGFLTGIAALS